MKKDADVPNILKMDGVDYFSTGKDQLTITHVPLVLKANKHRANWAHTVVDSESNSMTLICQSKGEGNRMHHHPDWDEVWVIYFGEWEIEFRDEVRIAKMGDIVFIERGRPHRIKAISDKAIRLAISRYDVDHVYQEDDYEPSV